MIMYSKLLAFLGIGMSTKNRKMKAPGFFSRLIKDDSNDSSINFLLVFVTILSALLLAMPIYAFIIDVWFNHTVTLSLDGMAAYIVAVTSLLTSAGLTAGWAEYSKNKFSGGNSEDSSSYKNKKNTEDEYYEDIE